MNSKMHVRERVDLDTKIYFREVQAGKWKSVGTVTVETNVLYDLPQKFATNFFLFKKP